MKDFTVASTTDSFEDVQAAAGMTPEVLAAEPLEAPSEAPEVPPVEEPTEPTTQPAPDEGQPETRRKDSHRWSKRVDKLTTDLYAERAESQKLREQLESLQRQNPAQPQQVQQPMDDKPIRTAFANDEAWVEAISEWKAKGLIQQMRQQEVQEQRQARDQNAYAGYLQRANDFAEQHPDFNIAATTPMFTPEVAGGIQSALVELDNGPEILYHIYQNQELAEEINEMNPARAAAQIGVIAASLNRPSPKPQRVLPKPITPVSGGTSRVAREPSEMNYQDYKRWRRENR